MKRITLTIILFSCCLSALCQSQENRSFSFERTDWDFGTIKEEDGKVSYTFNFTNTGSTSIVIEDVTTTCGCTAPEYSKKPVRAGEKGYIKVIYDPHDRYGVFNNEVTIITNQGRNRNILKIKGQIIPRPRSIEEDYPLELGSGFRVHSLTANMGVASIEEKKSVTIPYVNNSDKAITVDFSSFSGSSDFVVDSPGTVCPGCKGELVFRIASPKGTYGTVADHFNIEVNGKKAPLFISAKAVITDDFSNANPNRMAKIVIQPSSHDFGTIKAGSENTFTVKVTNQGTAPLRLRKIEVQNAEVVGSFEGRMIQPGMSMDMKVRFKPDPGKKGNQTGVVTVISNSPGRSIRYIRMLGIVK